MKFCSNCGSGVVWRIPEGDDSPRFVCESCNIIHYQNPKMVIGAIPSMDNKILMCRRAIEPCVGRWTLPAGYLENNETIEECALRESIEEAWAKLDNLQPYALLNLPFINQVYFIYRADLVNNDFHAGAESLEVKLIHPQQIPWDELAFKVIRRVLEMYVEDLKTNRFPFRVVDILPNYIKGDLVDHDLS